MKIKKILALILCVTLLIIPIQLQVNAANYSADYQKWSQGASDNSSMRTYGCWVVAQAKLIYETGIDRSEDFNPDTYLAWEQKNGYINSSYNQVNGGNAPVAYAKSLGKTIIYHGKTTSSMETKIWNNISNGYYTLICVRRSDGGEHYVMIANDLSKKNGIIYCYNSRTALASAEPGSVSGFGYTITDVYTYSTDNSNLVSITSYPDNNTISNTNAILWGKVEKPSSYEVTKIGIRVRKDGSTYDRGWSRYDTPSSDYVGSALMYPYYDLNAELNATLTPATKYWLQFYAIVNNKEYWSEEYYFTTTGTHTHDYTIHEYEAIHPHKYYRKCSCGDYYYTGETAKLSDCSDCIELKTPNLYSIKADGVNQVFDWDYVDNATSYTLKIYYKNNQEHSTWKNIKNSYIYINYINIPDGDYYATITAINENNGKTAESEKTYFTMAHEKRLIFDISNSGKYKDEVKQHDITGININRDEDCMVIYDYSNYLQTPTNFYGVEYAVDKNGLVIGMRDYSDETPLTIPKDGFAISETNSDWWWLSKNLKIGDYVAFLRNEKRIYIFKSKEDYDNYYKTFYYDTEKTTVNAPEKIGYKLTGWYSPLISEYITIENFDFTSDLLLTAQYEPLLYSKGECMYGDINFDNKLNILDIVKMKKMLAGDAENHVTADLDADNCTNSVDLSLLKNILLGSIKSGNLYFDANGGSVGEAQRSVLYGERIGNLPTPEKKGFDFAGWFLSDGSEITSDTLMTTENITATAYWNAKAYEVSWNTGTGYTITVKRTSSPYANASVGSLSSKDTVYYGDVLSITYSATAGYSLKSNGVEAMTVTGNITSSDIYATASANSYTYKIVYKSSNGTALGNATAKYKFGTTNTITPKDFAGYDTPSSQKIKWDSTSAKTITFTYKPTSVASSQNLSSGAWAIDGSTNYITYSVEAEYRNRTSSSVQVRVIWTNTLIPYYYYQRGQVFNATIGGISTGNVTIVPYNAWVNSTSSNRSLSGSSDWISVPVSTSQTSVSISADAYKQHSDGSLTNINESFTKTFAIPTY